MELTEALKMDAGGTIGKYNADGGATKNRYLMQFQADILQQEVNTAEMAETTALGAAFFAGLATGFFPNLEYIKKHQEKHRYIQTANVPGRSGEKV